MLGLAAATLLSKYRKIATFDELLDRLFFLGKAAVAVLLFFVGVPHVATYVILWAGIYWVIMREFDSGLMPFSHNRHDFLKVVFRNCSCRR